MLIKLWKLISPTRKSFSLLTPYYQNLLQKAFPTFILKQVLVTVCTSRPSIYASQTVGLSLKHILWRQECGNIGMFPTHISAQVNQSYGLQLSRMGLENTYTLFHDASFKQESTQDQASHPFQSPRSLPHQSLTCVDPALIVHLLSLIQIVFISFFDFPQPYFTPNHDICTFAYSQKFVSKKY